MDLVIAPTGVGFNTQSGAPKLALQAGQIIDALVLQLIDATTVRLAVGDSVIDVQTKVALEPGASVRLAVKGTATDLKLVILAGAPLAATARPPLAPTSPAIRPVPDAARRPGVTAHPVAATIITPAMEESGELPTVAASMAGAPAVDLADPAPPLDATRAVVQAIQASASRQSGLAPLYADATQALAAPNLPPVVKQAIAHLFAPHLPLMENATELSAEELRQAFVRSGVLFEARVAGALRGAGPLPAVTNDVKAALVSVRHFLSTWLAANLPPAPAGETETVAAQTLPSENPLPPEQSPRMAPASAGASPPSASALPPPYHGAPPAAQPPAAPSVSPDWPPHDIVHALLDEVDGAVARQTLLQVASLPDTANAASAPAESPAPRWHFELPFATLQGMAVVPFEIVPDGRQGAAAGIAPTWRARFSIDVEPLGPVHAQVAVTGSRTAVRLWAERAATTAALRANAAALGEALSLVDLEPGDVLVREGTPRRPGETAAAGRFLDRAS